jgi:hypothetical protein
VTEVSVAFGARDRGADHLSYVFGTSSFPWLFYFPV